MIKLKNISEIEISSANAYSDFNPYYEIRDFVNNKKFKIPKSKKIDTFEKYRFFENINGIYIKTYMMLPDRNYIIGTIRAEKDSNYRISDTYYVDIDVSMIHKNFRGQGLGKILYKYFILKHKIITSDTTLTTVSYHLWTDLLKKMIPSGELYVSRILHEEYSIVKYDESIRDSEIIHFIFYSDKKYIPKYLK